MNNSEYYNYPNNFYYDRCVVREDTPYFSSPNDKIKNIVWVKSGNESRINKAFIKKVLSAVELESLSTYEIHFSEQAPTLSEVKKNFPKLQFLLSFGFRPREMGLQTHNHFNQWIYLNDCRLLFSQSLEELEPNAQLKMQLWNQLKKMDRS